MPPAVLRQYVQNQLRRISIRKGFLLFSILLFAAPVSSQTKTAANATVAFVGVNVVPMDKERVLTDQTVLVRNGARGLVVA